MGGGWWVVGGWWLVVCGYIGVGSSCMHARGGLQEEACKRPPGFGLAPTHPPIILTLNHPPTPTYLYPPAPTHLYPPTCTHQATFIVTHNHSQPTHVHTQPPMVSLMQSVTQPYPTTCTYSPSVCSIACIFVCTCCHLLLSHKSLQHLAGRGAAAMAEVAEAAVEQPQQPPAQQQPHQLAGPPPGAGGGGDKPPGDDEKPKPVESDAKYPGED